MAPLRATNTDAVGVRFNDLPVTPDRVFEALEKRRRGAARSGNGASNGGAGNSA